MTETVTLTIDGTEITVPKGTTIIQAAEKAGAEIPRFCWHPGLSVAGVCRFCMVKVEGMPKLQISCNTVCADGMKVTTKDAEVKDAHKWALEFHLINHPLDCPICDQAGECELQNSYMKVGKYVSQMKEDKVLKPKALDVGDNLVLDTERCILCSRCVRFENEVTKTNALGIFNRGDRSIIGTFPGKRINHNYSYNLVDVCPVGAFTAKDFRFKCRVWFLKEVESICPGCSTGCNVNVFYKKKKQEYYRLKPRYNAKINGHWMCDYGRTMYHHLNASERFALPLKNGAEIPWREFHVQFAKILKELNEKSDVRVVLTPQYTNEEYEQIFATFKEIGNFKKIEWFLWRDRHENRKEFDDLLFRGDRNPNTKGLEHILDKLHVTATVLNQKTLEKFLADDVFTLIFAPEVQSSYKSFAEDVQFLSQLKNAICFTVNHFTGYKEFRYTVPVRAFIEKTGSFTNFSGVTQALNANPPVFHEQPSVSEIFESAVNQLAK
jgi:NADH-quinone oxidoreductase subunit G